jgi:hypothetical protein
VADADVVGAARTVVMVVMVVMAATPPKVAA